jgi:hypothetical protein
MPNSLSRLYPTRRIGDEPLHSNGRPLGLSLLDYWSWSASDIVSNAQRGVLAEFIVASAIGVDLNGVRDEWGAYDLTTPDGIRVEVKSAGFIQSWEQIRYSTIMFNVPKTRAWNSDTNIQEKESRRQAQVYVFALLAHKDKLTIDPLNVDQWVFYVLPTAVLDARTRSQVSITLRSLENLAGPGIPYEDLREAVAQAAKELYPPTPP